MNARAGVRKLVDLFSEADWADLGVLTLDWKGMHGAPFMNVEVFRFFPEYNGRHVRIYENYDIDEIFGADNADTELFPLIVLQFREKMEEAMVAGPPER
jgi:hypothetical protein